MIRVLVDVHSEAIRVRVAVWAGSIEQALNLTGGTYPDCQAKVVFPIDPETFFAEGSAPALGTLVPMVSEKAAG